MNPTIVCNDYVNDTVDLTYEEFGSVVLTSGGSTVSILRCDTATSSAISLSTDSAYLTNADFYTLWPAVAGLLVAGYIVKRLLAVLV